MTHWTGSEGGSQTRQTRTAEGPFYISSDEGDGEDDEDYGNIAETDKKPIMLGKSYDRPSTRHLALERARAEITDDDDILSESISEINKFFRSMPAARRYGSPHTFSDNGFVRSVRA